MNRNVVILLSAMLAAASCADELPQTRPKDAGLSARKLAELSAELERLVERRRLAGGVVLVARRGKVAYTRAFGLRDVASGSTMTEDTIFQIASMTKPITAAAAMILVEEGKIGLDDPASKYLPELKDLRVLGDPKDDQGDEIATVPATRQITVRDLLTHTSGFAYEAPSPNTARLQRLYDKIGIRPRSYATIAEQVEKHSKAALAHHPGEAWTYGQSSDVLGRLIEVAAGKRFDRLLRERLFDPLDMKDTHFLVPEAKRDRVATIYQPEGANLTPLPRRFGFETYFSGGGGLYSTARDYARFAQMILNGGKLQGRRILEAETVRQMTSNQIGDLSAFGMKYGFGFGLSPLIGSEPPMSEYTWSGQYSTTFWIDPSKELVGVVLSQVLPINHEDLGLIAARVAEAAAER